MPGTKGLMG